MKINSVSFNGTFRLNRSDLTEKVVDKLSKEEEPMQMIIENGGYRNQDNIYINLPYKFDEKLIKMLNKLNVNYSQISETEALDTDNIISRMILSDDAKFQGCSLENINLKRLDEELQKNKEYYVSRNSANIFPFRYIRFERFLKTNQDIEAPIVSLKQLKNGEINTKMIDGRHRIAVFKDMGLPKIPVSIDESSAKLAREIGLI